MVKIFKIAGIAAAVVAVLLVIAVASINLVPGRYYKNLIISGVESATGRELAIEGELDIKLLDTFAFKVSGVKFSNAGWGSRPFMASVDNLEAEVALFPLLKGVLDASLVVDKPDLLLETNSSGRGNWQFDEKEKDEPQAAKGARKGEEAKEAEAEEEGGGLPLKPLIRKLNLNQTRFAYVDGQNGNRLDIHSEKLYVGSKDKALAIELEGQYNAIPLALSGGLDNDHFFVDNQPAGVQLNGHFGNAKLKVQGTAGPLSPTFDVDVTVTLDTDSLATFAPLAGGDLPDIGPLSISARLTGKEGQYGLSDLMAKLDDQSLSAQAAGSIADLVALDGLKLAVAAETGQLADVLGLFGFKPEYKLPESVIAKVEAEGNLKELTIKQFEAGIQGLGINATVKGRAKNIITLEGVQVDVSFDAASLDPIAKIAKIQLPPFAPLKAKANVVARGQNLGLMDITFNLRGKSIQTDISGSIGDPFKLKEVNTDINISAGSLAWLKDYVKIALPPLGRLNANANIVSNGDTFAANGIKAALTGGKVEATVAGSVGDLLKFKEVNADIDLGVESLDVLSEVAKTDLPPVGPLNLSASIASKGETLEAKRIKIDLTDEKIQATVAGSVGDLLKFKEVNADIDLRIESLDVLSEVAKTELPPLDPLNLSANIVSRGETFEAKEIKLDLAGEKIQVKIAASVRDLMTVAGINADVDINVDSLASLDAIVKQKLPKSGPVALEGNISSEGLKSPVKITTVIKSDGVKANLNGSIADIPAADGIDMTFTVEADSMQKVGRLSGLQLQGREPLKLEGRFTAAQKAYQLAGLHLQAGKLKVDGKAAFKPASEAGGRPQLSAEINVGALDLSKRQKQKQKDSSEESEPSSTSNETEAGQQESDVKERLFPGEPLPFESLRAVDVDVDITVARLTTLQVQLEDLAVGLTLDNGLLGLAPIQAKVGNGTFSGEAVLDARNTPAALSVDLHLADATFRDFGGNLDLLVDLDGKGDSVAAIMAGLNGVLEVDIQDATLKKSIMTSFGSDLLSHLNPFDKDEDKIELICAIALFNISDGMADAKHKIAAQMTDVTWFGGGEIDLKTEEIGFHFKPKARKGLGISLGSLASLVSVGGTLADPKIRLNLKDVAVKYGKYLAASATGGLSLVADLLWSKVKANTDVCAAILEHLETEEEAEQEHKE